jgi:hypothetical protein
MESFGTVMARLIAESLVLLEGTFSHWVNVTVVDGNITSIALSPLGEQLTSWWASLAVSFAWSMDQMLRALWTVSG